MIAADCPSVSIHNTVTAYTDHRCRCPRARELMRIGAAERKIRKVAAGGPLRVDPTGSRRRLQALAVNCWGAVHLAERFDRDHAQVNRWMTGWDHRPTMLRSTVDRITAVYLELWDVEGPSDRVRAMALRKGWASSVCWLGRDMDDPAATPWPYQEPDWVAVERIAAGLLPWRERTKLERRLAVAILHRQGLTKNAIGMRLENTREPDANAERLVQRDVTWLRAAGLVERWAS